MNNLVVVESPAKSKTIGRYLNKGPNSNNYRILATGGHIYESSKVDIDDDFKLKYELIDSKRKAVDLIVTAMRTADRLYLATDPDREGEAISKHVLDHLEARGALKGKQVHRIVFYEVTSQAILDSIENPGDISENLVQAQQSRDALDMLVGFNLSPLLIRKLRTPHLSAGRVQSPALRLIVERQREIDQFIPVEYWSIAAELIKPDDSGNPAEKKPVLAPLTHLSGKKLGKQEIDSEDSVKAAVADLEESLEQTNRELTVSAVTRKKKKSRPPPPFKTSTFVQSATQRLRRSAADVTRIAQKLYEGLEINGTLTGLITYTRTDSLTLSSVATKQIREFISAKFGDQQMPGSARLYKTKSKTAQEAHEAIRPTDIFLTPEKVRSSLSPEQFAVYDLIWKRTVASQMNDAVFEEVAVDLTVDEHRFRATGSTMISAGWRAVIRPYAEEKSGADSVGTLPPFVEGERVPVARINTEQHFTKPPARYNAGSLVKQLEDYGIGRPSTWPTIINKLVDRNYVTIKNQAFYAQSLGCMVVDYLNHHFALYVDYAFTGKVEDKLDDIAQGEIGRLKVLNDFWSSFSSHLDSKLAAPSFEVNLGIDPETERELLVRVRSGQSYLQLGRRTDDEKPVFRSLPKDTDPGSVTLDAAIEAFSGPSLPRKLEEKTRDGCSVEIKSGRYGPYFSCTNEDGKVENFSLEDSQDPFLISIEDIESILSLPRLPRSLGATDEYADIVASAGRFGPYLSVKLADGEKFNLSLSKEDNPAKITLDRAIEVIKTSSRKPGAKGRQRTAIKSFKNSKIQVLDGRYGPYITDGKTNVSVPKSVTASDLELETCRELLDQKRRAGPKKRSSTRRKKG